MITSQILGDAFRRIGLQRTAEELVGGSLGKLYCSTKRGRGKFFKQNESYAPDTVKVSQRDYWRGKWFLEVANDDEHW